MQTLTFRPSDILLDRVLNPAGDFMLGDCEPEHLIEACGIIPEFFAQACLSADPLTLDEIANQMDEAYSFGGFRYPFGGDITVSGVYQSEHPKQTKTSPRWPGLSSTGSSALCINMGSSASGTARAASISWPGLTDPAAPHRPAIVRAFLLGFTFSKVIAYNRIHRASRPATTEKKS
jgi:hypothetical protein